MDTVGTMGVQRRKEIQKVNGRNNIAVGLE